MLIVELREIIDLLPPVNRELVAIIMRHLKRVADMSADNQMSAKNLSIIFGPTLLTANNKSLAIVDNIHQARVVELMITWANQIFPQYANYESKAVIELNFSQEEEERKREIPDRSGDVCRFDSNEKSPKSGDKSEQELIQSSDNNNNNNNSNDNNHNNSRKKIFGNQKRSKDKQPKTKSDTEEADSNQRVVEPSSDLNKMRDDIKELRRQFFTVPQVRTNLVLTDSDPSRALKLTESTHELGNKTLKHLGPSGSVPVIKVQPYFCDLLTKYAKNERR